MLSDILQPGLYYLNRYAYQVNVIEIGMNQVTMAAGSNESMVSTRSRLSNATDALAELESNTLNFQKELRRERAERMNAAPAVTVSGKVPSALFRSRKLRRRCRPRRRFSASVARSNSRRATVSRSRST